MGATVCLGVYMKKVKSPCYKCEDRVVGCHGSCEKYKAYAGIVADNRAERFEANEKNHALISKRREKERAKFKGEQ